MKLQIVPRAQAQVRSRRTWWIEHRPDSPKLFDEELERAVRLVRETPGVGARWPTVKHPGSRWVLMPKIHSHLYFYLDEPKMTVVFLAVWGTARAQGLKL